MMVVNGREVDWEEGMSVARVLEVMSYTSHLIFVKVNGRVVKKDDWEQTTVDDGDVVEAIHLVGGG